MKTKHTQHTHSARIGALAISFALLFGMVPIATAAADELTGSGGTGKPAATIVLEVSTTLAANVDAAATATSLTSGTGFVSGDLALIGNEVVTLTTVATDTVSLMSRATELNSVSTTAEAHRSGDTVRNIDQNVQIVFESGSHSIQSGEKIVITVPDDFANFGAIIATDVAVTTETPATFTVNATETFDYLAKTITITATADAPGANEAVTITIGTSSTNQLDMPAKPGNYAFHIAIKNVNDEVLETGYALFSWANEVKVRAVVAEALILTIDDTTVNLNVDPSVDDGEDFSQKTILTAKTNAKTGYMIQGKLLDSGSAATLKNADTADTIVGGDAEITENTFAYVSYNGDGAASPTITGTTTRTKAEIKTDVNVMSSFTNSLANLTKVDATASNATPTTDGLGYGGVTNESKHTVYYALNVDYLTPAGTYEGTITYVALPTF